MLRSRCLLYFSDIIYSSSSRTHLLTPSGKKLGEKIALKYLTTRHETPCSYYLLKALIIATRSSSCLVMMKSFCLILHFCPPFHGKKIFQTQFCILAKWVKNARFKCCRFENETWCFDKQLTSQVSFSHTQIIFHGCNQALTCTM